MLPPRQYVITIKLFDGTEFTYNGRVQPSPAELTEFRKELNFRRYLSLVSQAGEESFDYSPLIRALRLEYLSQGQKKLQGDDS